jgi:hypothetical protein
MSTICNNPDVYIEEEIAVHLWCDLCEYILKSEIDITTHRESGCCEECWLTFGQARKNEWESGWRPNEEILNRYKQQRKIINIDIMQILGE